MRKKNKQKKALVIFMLVIFVLSTIGSVVVYYSGGDDSSTRSYSNVKYRFKPTTDNFGNQYYDVSYKDEKFTAYFLPEYMDLDMDDDSKSLVSRSSYFYLTFDPADANVQLMDYLRFDIRNNLPASKFFFDSVSQPDANYNLPIIGCANATASAPVIMLLSGNKTNLEREGSCLKVTFTQANVLQVRDSLVYLFNGVEI